MKSYILAPLLGLLALASNAFADTSSVVRQIAEAQGMRDLVGSLLDNAKANASGLTKKTMAEVLARSGNLSAAQKKGIDEAAQKFLTGINKSLDPEKYVSVWVSEYSKHVTEEQAKAILAYYVSEAGKVDVEAAKVSSLAIQTYFQQVVGATMQSEAAIYMEEVKKALAPAQ